MKRRPKSGIFSLEATTVFAALRPMIVICRFYNINKVTSYRWLKQRDKIGTPIYHHTRKLSKVLGRNSQVTKNTINMFLSPSRNPVRKQRLEGQIAFHELLVKHR